LEHAPLLQAHCQAADDNDPNSAPQHTLHYDMTGTKLAETEQLITGIIYVTI